MNLIGNMGKSNSKTYKTLTKSDLAEALKGFQSSPQPQDMVIHTGMAGMKMFDHAMKAEVETQRLSIATKLLMELIRNYDVDAKEIESISEMIHSKDPESWELANQLIEIKTKSQFNDTTKIHRS